MLPIQNDCIFCTIANTDRRDLKEYDQPILETRNFIVVVALGHFVDGYLLICPKRHYLNIGSLDTELIDEYLELKSAVTRLLKKAYSKPAFFFEHGAAAIRGVGASCVDHAHLHVIPLEITDPRIWNPNYHVDEKVMTMKGVFEYAKLGAPYMLFEKSFEEIYLYDALLLPCQYGRRIIANYLGKGKYWNWRNYPFKSRAIKTAKYLKTLI